MEDKLVSKHILDASQYEGKENGRELYKVGLYSLLFMALHAYQTYSKLC